MRRLCLVAGVLICLAVWFLPAPAFVPMPVWSFADHMSRHMAVVAVAAPLIALGLGSVIRIPNVPALGAMVAEFVVVWGWHLPAAHEAAQRSAIWFAAEQGSYLVVGLGLWLSVLGPGKALAGAGALLLTSMHMTLLGALLILTRQPLYAADICGGLADQQLGGMIMLGIGTPVYLIAGLWLTARALAQEPEPSV